MLTLVARFRGEECRPTVIFDNGAIKVRLNATRLDLANNTDLIELRFPNGDILPKATWFPHKTYLEAKFAMSTFTEHFLREEKHEQKSSNFVLLERNSRDERSMRPSAPYDAAIDVMETTGFAPEFGIRSKRSHHVDHCLVDKTSLSGCTIVAMVDGNSVHQAGFWSVEEDASNFAHVRSDVLTLIRTELTNCFSHIVASQLKSVIVSGCIQAIWATVEKYFADHPEFSAYTKILHISLLVAIVSKTSITLGAVGNMSAMLLRDGDDPVQTIFTQTMHTKENPSEQARIDQVAQNRMIYQNCQPDGATSHTNDAVAPPAQTRSLGLSFFAPWPVFHDPYICTLNLEPADRTLVFCTEGYLLNLCAGQPDKTGCWQKTLRSVHAKSGNASLPKDLVDRAFENLKGVWTNLSVHDQQSIIIRHVVSTNATKMGPDEQAFVAKSVENREKYVRMPAIAEDMAVAAISLVHM